MHFLLDYTPDLLLYSLYASLAVTSFFSFVYAWIQIHYDSYSTSDLIPHDHDVHSQFNSRDMIDSFNSPTHWLLRTIRLKLASNNEDDSHCKLNI
ncbi:hypothetical protein [Bacillus sp. 2205SS5-2]|uniref:hypothetical protein n=1 Tax=Bacillus sp. 2205SS5-2 TaxID=3109031 RepID=UPI0030073F1C